MPESQSIGRVMDVIDRVNEVKPETFSKMSEFDASIRADNLSERNGITKKNSGEFLNGQFLDPKDGVNLEADEIIGQEPTVEDVLNRVVDLSKGISERSEASAKSAIDRWEHLGNKADELGATSQMEAVAKAEEIVSKHARAEQIQQELAENIIDTLAKDDFKGASSKLIDLTVESYILDMPEEVRDGLDAKTISPSVLKEDPRFADYRKDIVKRVQDHGQKTKGNPWQGLKTALKFGINADGYHDFVNLMGEARILADLNTEIHPDNLPSLDLANNYLAHFDQFQRDAQISIDRNAVLNAMPALLKERQIDQQEKIDANIEAVYDDAHSENKAYDLAKLNKAQAEVGLRLQAEGLAAREKQAGQELNSLSMEAILFANAAERDAEVAGKGLAILAEYQYKEDKLAEFDAKIKDGSFGEFQDIVNADYAQEVNLFIESKGKKGDYKSVEKLFNSLDKVITKPYVQDGVSTSFITLNTLNEGNRSIETGLLAGFAEDGSWEIKLATKQGEQITESNPELPVIRLQPEGILASLKLIESQNEAIKVAQQELAKEKIVAKLVGGTAENRKAHKAALKAAEANVAAFTSAINASKSELATKLQATDSVKTLGGALKEMSDAQSQVAEAFYSQDYNEMLNDFASELNLKPSQVTPEVLATIVSSAEYASDRANEMSNYFTEVATPGLIEAKVMASAEPWIMNMAFDYARLQEDETLAKSFNDPILEGEAVKVINRRKVVLQKQAKELAQVLNQELVNTTPEAFRKGSTAIGMTKSELKKSVAETLRFSGFDAEKYQKSTESRPVTVAQRTYDMMSYDSELKAIANKAIDAMRDMGDTSATQNLIDALEGGDVSMFMENVKSIQEQITESTIDTRRAESDSRKLKELMSTPEGIIEAMKTGELYWGTAVDAAINGEASSKAVIEGLKSLPDKEVRQEAARRFQVEIQQKIKDAGVLMVGEADPLAGHPDLAAQADFVNEETNKQFNNYWKIFIDRASAEKKTQLGSE